MKSLYETKISDARWIAYDLPGNVGWIAYIVSLIICFAKSSDIMQSSAVKGIVIAAAFPAILMLIGIAELIRERIKKQDRILSGRQLILGFGALTLGGTLGALASLFAIILGAAKGMDVTLFVIMCAGGALCGLFAGLLYKGYRPT